jgi:hypothetical protein
LLALTSTVGDSRSLGIGAPLAWTPN